MKFILSYTDMEMRSIVTQREPYKIRKNEFLIRKIENELMKLFKLELDLPKV